MTKDEETLTGLVKRWLKAQLGIHGDPRRGHQEQREADPLEGRMRPQAEGDWGRALAGELMPAEWKRTLADMERQGEERKAEQARRRRAEHEARPRARVRLALRGQVVGGFEGAMPVTVQRPEEPGEALTVELEPLEPLPVGGRAFLGFQFAVPAYGGPGAYDRTALAARDGMDDWDPLWFQLWLDTTDEPFYWVPEYGPASVAVEGDGRTLRVRMAMEDAGSTRVEVDATVALP